MQRLNRSSSNGRGERGSSGGSMSRASLDKSVLNMDKSMLPGHSNSALSSKLEATRAAFRDSQVSPS